MTNTFASPCLELLRRSVTRFLFLSRSSCTLRQYQPFHQNYTCVFQAAGRLLKLLETKKQKKTFVSVCSGSSNELVLFQKSGEKRGGEPTFVFAAQALQLVERVTCCESPDASHEQLWKRAFDVPVSSREHRMNEVTVDENLYTRKQRLLLAPNWNQLKESKRDRKAKQFRGLGGGWGRTYFVGLSEAKVHLEELECFPDCLVSLYSHGSSFVVCPVTLARWGATKS